MNYDPLYHPYPSRRSLVYGRRGMVATSQPLAAQAGLDMLKQGGNAIDAAIATAVCLTVLEPCSNGIGSDAFAIIHSGGQLYGLNASGPAPKSLTVENLKKAGYDKMPQFGIVPVTVPGAPAAWAELSSRFGKLPFAKLFEPAIYYAENGYAVSPVISKLWKRSLTFYDPKNDLFKPFFEVFSKDGGPIAAGQVWKSPAHASTLRSIAQTHAKSFYEGDLAEKMEDFAQKNGGFLTVSDLASFKPEWVNPLKMDYQGYEVWELPPNGQGLVVLMALNILKGFEFQEKDSIDNYHRQIEAMKIAFSDGIEHITDPQVMKVRPEDFLTCAYGEEMRRKISPVAQPARQKPHEGGTVYLAAADDQGNMVSFIQSNFYNFGSGIVIPGTGISLQNRGSTFSVDPDHINCVAGGKRTYHTIIPGFLTKNGQPVGPFGIMGGYIQPQAHTQVLINLLDYNLNPQAALDAPRWQWLEDNTVEVEYSFPEYMAEALIRRGHNVIRSPIGSISYGRGQIIFRGEAATLIGATEPRADGTVAVW